MSYGHAGFLAAQTESACSSGPSHWRTPPTCPDCGAVAVYAAHSDDGYDAYLCPTLDCERVFVLVMKGK